MAQIPIGSIPAYFRERLGDDSPCVTYPGDTLTWSQLDERSNQKARAFLDLGVTEDSFVTLAMPNGCALFEALFATWKLGATANVVSSRMPRQELAAVIDLASPALLVMQQDLKLVEDTQVFTDTSAWRHYPGDALEVKTPKSWKAMTSGGSTGRPKIIVEPVAGTMDTELEFLSLPIERCVMDAGPMYHNGPFNSTILALCNGNHIVGMTRFDPELCLQQIDRYKVEWSFMVPTMMLRMMRLPEEVKAQYDLSSLKLILHSASPMPEWLKRAWIDWIGPEKVGEMYGGTEKTGLTYIDGVEWLAHPGSVGKPIDGSSIRIVTDDGRDADPGEVGEIYMLPAAGPGSTYRYIGAEAKRLGDGWETLGDIGWLDDEGYLYIVDRRVDLIISGGANIYPAEVEVALSEHPGVASVAVIGLPHKDLGQAVHAIVQRNPDCQPLVESADLLAYLADKLSLYKIPRSIEFVPMALRDDAGKVRRSALRAARVAGS